MDKLHFDRTDYSVVVKNRAPLRNRGDGFIELGLYQLYQLKECFLARALRGYDIKASRNRRITTRKLRSFVEV